MHQLGREVNARVLLGDGRHERAANQREQHGGARFKRAKAPKLRWQGDGVTGAHSTTLLRHRSSRRFQPGCGWSVSGCTSMASSSIPNRVVNSSYASSAHALRQCQRCPCKLSGQDGHVSLKATGGVPSPPARGHRAGHGAVPRAAGGCCAGSQRETRVLCLWSDHVFPRSARS